MYRKLPNLVIGFHGCDRSVFDKVIKESEPMRMSMNKHDWLGHGIYFWENSYERASEWAIAQSKRKDTSIKEPAVIGAVIDLGHCLNLTDYQSSDILRRGYELLELFTSVSGLPMPENKNAKNDSDMIIRNLDCAVIEQIHDFNRATGREPYDSVRGVFVEGKEVYPGSGFKEKTHIQLCITNPNCIKGCFDPRKPNKKFRMP